MLKAYKGKTLSVINSTKIIKNIPDIDQYRELMKWKSDPSK